MAEKKSFWSDLGTLYWGTSDGDQRPPPAKVKAAIKKAMPKAKTKMVLAPHRNPTNKKVRVADRPSKRRRPINKSGSSRLRKGGKT
tara:strand:+ start:336 stop:593 length:258 start_codon:yes stop_codon:yes gene_type:complete